MVRRIPIVAGQPEARLVLVATRPGGNGARNAGRRAHELGSFFSGPAWEYDDHTDEYYLHLFSRKQPDLNWENPEVRQAVYEMMRWWLDRGVDGFRMDVINFISKVVGPDGSLPDVPPEGTIYGGPASATINGPRVHEFLAEMHREVFHGRREALLLVGETPGATVEHGKLFTDPARHELDMVFTFEHMVLDHGPGGHFERVPLQLADLKATMTRWQTGLADVGWNALYWDNHDQPRIVSRWGDDSRYRRESATMLAIVLHLHRGTPYIYQGEELGMTNAGFTSFDQFRDIETLNFVAIERELGVISDQQLLTWLAQSSRDNARTPMQWDATSNAGFTTGNPWIDVNPNHEFINAAAETADPDSVFHMYRRLIALRHENPVVREGEFRLVLEDHPHVYAFTRTLGDERLLVLGNFSGDEQLAAVGPEWAGSELVLGNYRPSATATPDGVTLRPWEAVVLAFYP